MGGGQGWSGGLLEGLLAGQLDRWSAGPTDGPRTVGSGRTPGIDPLQLTGYRDGNQVQLEDRSHWGRTAISTRGWGLPPPESVPECLPIRPPPPL